MVDGDDDTIPAEVSETPAEEVPAEVTAADAPAPAKKELPYDSQKKENGVAPIRTIYGYNYTLAFTLMVNGMNLVDIAREHNFDFQKLATRARREKWRVLAKGSWDRLYRQDRRPDQQQEFKKGELPELVDKRLKAIQNNRDKITDAADTLRTQILRVAEALNKLPIDQFTDPEEISNITKSIAALTKSAKDIADMTMVALGDDHAIRHLSQNGQGKTPGNDGPSIIINMPGILATSRRRMKPAERIADAKDEVARSERAVARQAKALPEGLSHDAAGSDSAQ